MRVEKQKLCFCYFQTPYLYGNSIWSLKVTDWFSRFKITICKILHLNQHILIFFKHSMALCLRVTTKNNVNISIVKRCQKLAKNRKKRWENGWQLKSTWLSFMQDIIKLHKNWQLRQQYVVYNCAWRKCVLLVSAWVCLCFNFSLSLQMDRLGRQVEFRVIKMISHTHKSTKWLLMNI